MRGTGSGGWMGGALPLGSHSASTIATAAGNFEVDRALLTALGLSQST